jgi:hypothetical protein
LNGGGEEALASRMVNVVAKGGKVYGMHEGEDEREEMA